MEKETLELKHLKGYLGTGLKMYWEDFDNKPKLPWELKGHNIDFAIENQNRPILHHLSSLTKEITHNGETFVPYDLFVETFGSNDDTLFENMNDENDELHWSVCKDLPYYVIEWLLTLHFDIHNLIESGKATQYFNETFQP